MLQLFSPILVLRSVKPSNHHSSTHCLRSDLNNYRAKFDYCLTLFELFHGSYHSISVIIELSSGIEPNYPDYKSGASPAMLWEQIMYQFHTGLLGTIRVSRTRCTTQSAIMCYQLLGFHHKELVNGVRTHLIECMPTSTFTAHLIHCTPYGARTRKLSRERGVS